MTDGKARLADSLCPDSPTLRCREPGSTGNGKETESSTARRQASRAVELAPSSYCGRSPSAGAATSACATASRADHHCHVSKAGAAVTSHGQSTEGIPVQSSGWTEGLSESDVCSLRAVLGHEMAANTIANYRTQWKYFVLWTSRRGISALPADPIQVAAYLAERMEERGHKPATLRVAASAIAFAHRTAGLDDPCASAEVKRTLRSATRKAGRSQKQAEALTVEAFAAIRSTAHEPRRGRGGKLETREAARYRGNLDIALISLMRDAMLRVSEAAALTWGDLFAEPDGTGRLMIRRSKNRCGRPGSRRIPVCSDYGGPQPDPGGNRRHRQRVPPAPQPDIQAHQTGSTGRRPGRGFQRTLSQSGHGPGPGQSRNRAAKPDERRTLAHTHDAGALHPQRISQQGRRGAVPPPARRA